MFGEIVIFIITVTIVIIRRTPDIDSVLERYLGFGIGKFLPGIRLDIYGPQQIYF